MLRKGLSYTARLAAVGICFFIGLAASWGVTKVSNAFNRGVGTATHEYTEEDKLAAVVGRVLDGAHDADFVSVHRTLSADGAIATVHYKSENRKNFSISIKTGEVMTLQMVEGNTVLTYSDIDVDGIVDYAFVQEGAFKIQPMKNSDEAYKRAIDGIFHEWNLDK